MFIVFLYYSFDICNISNFIVFHSWYWSLVSSLFELIKESAHLSIILFSYLSMPLISALIFIALFILLAFILRFSFLSHPWYHEFWGAARWVQWWPPGRNIHIRIPRIYKYCLILWNMIKVRVLKRDTYPGLSRSALHLITKVFLQGTQERFERQKKWWQYDHRGRDVATSQGSPGFTRSWRKQGTESPLETLGNLISDFRPPDLWE